MESRIKVNTSANRPNNVDFSPWKQRRIDTSALVGVTAVENPGVGIISTLMNGPVLGERLFNSTQDDHKDNAAMSSSAIVVGKATETFPANTLVYVDKNGDVRQFVSGRCDRMITVLNAEELPGNSISFLVTLHPKNNNSKPEGGFVGVTQMNVFEDDSVSVAVQHVTHLLAPYSKKNIAKKVGCSYSASSFI